MCRLWSLAYKKRAGAVYPSATSRLQVLDQKAGGRFRGGELILVRALAVALAREDERSDVGTGLAAAVATRARATCSPAPRPVDEQQRAGDVGVQ